MAPAGPWDWLLFVLHFCLALGLIFARKREIFRGVVFFAFLGGVFALFCGDFAFWGVISRFGGVFSRYASIISLAQCGFFFWLFFSRVNFAGP